MELDVTSHPETPQERIAKMAQQSAIDRYNVQVTTTAAGGEPVYMEMPNNPDGFHPSVPRMGIACACAECTAKREATP